jgi:erythromycin esterase-like protein
MFETLRRILEARGRGSKAVVWAHNAHIGDARHTEMGAVRDEVNIGQLARETFGQEAALIGFGTHSGTVAAASDWDLPMQVMRVNPSYPGSYESVCHAAADRSGHPRFLVDLGAARATRMSRDLAESRPERFIGVIYRPQTELLSHYAQASLPGQFDAWVWLDETTAITPLESGPAGEGMPETWPFGA